MAKKYSLEVIKDFLLNIDSLGDAVSFLETKLDLSRKKLKKKAKKEAKRIEKSYNKVVLAKEGTLNTGQVNQNVLSNLDK